MDTADPQFEAQDGGPPPYRPLSGGAVTALVLSLLMAIPAFIGLWWLMALPVLVVLLSWSGVSSGRRRGKALLWIALIISAGIGASAWWMQGALAKQIDRGVSPLFVALDKDDRVTLEKWALESMDRPAAFDLWKSRLEKVRKEAGPWSGHLRFDRGWTGVMMRVLMTPSGATEVEPVGAQPIEMGKALWFCLPHSREDVWLALELGEPGKFDDAHKLFWSRVIGVASGVGGPKDGPDGGTRLVRDVRVFRLPR